MVKYVPSYTKFTLKKKKKKKKKKKRSAKNISNDAYQMILWGFFSSVLLYKSICCGYSFEMHEQVDAIQMGTHYVCLYKAVDNKYTDCYLKTTKLLDCALIGICVVIRLNMLTCCCT